MRSTSYRGLFNFVRYIENLQKYEVDFGEAKYDRRRREYGADHLSIHKSKGTGVSGRLCGRTRKSI